MRHTARWLALTILAALALSACEAPRLPSVAGTDAKVTEDDREVMRAVLAAMRQRSRGETTGRRLRLSGTGPGEAGRFLVFDVTTAYCERDPLIERPSVRGCIEEGLHSLLRRLTRMS